MIQKQTYKAVFALQILLGELLSIQVLQNKRTANLRPPNTLAHLRNPLPLQTCLFNTEIDHHTGTGKHEQQRSLPRERTGRVALAQLTHRLGASPEGSRREAIACGECALDFLGAPGSLCLRVGAALWLAGVAEGRENAMGRGGFNGGQVAGGSAEDSGGHPQ